MSHIITESGTSPTRLTNFLNYKLIVLAGINDKRHQKIRFRWVKRLMQGQPRLLHSAIIEGSLNTRDARPRAPRIETEPLGGSNRASRPKYSSQNVASHKPRRQDDTSEVDDASVGTEESDNVSTIPVKSIFSVQSTHSPSIISTNPRDYMSCNASTTNTSLGVISQSGSGSGSASASAPYTTHIPAQNTFLDTVRQEDQDLTITEHHRAMHVTTQQNMASQTSVRSGNSGGSGTPVNPGSGQFNIMSSLSPPQDRDSESIITLASSSRRMRRKSVETNSSTTGIPPASIFDRLANHMGHTGTSSYAESTKTSNTEYAACELTE